MRDKQKKIFVFTIIGLILSISILSIFLAWWYRSIDQINITNDGDFEWKYHFPGKGSKENPYIISGYRFTDMNRHAMRIYGTTRYFVIENCSFVNSTYTAIEILDVKEDTVQIKNNYFAETYMTLIFIDVIGIVIEGNTFENNRRAIDNQGGGRFLIRNNTFRHQNDEFTDAFYIYGIRDVIVENNTFENYDNGFFISFSQYVKIRNNTISNCNGGFFIEQCVGVDIINNKGSNGNTGFEIKYCENVYVLNNTFTNYSWRAILVMTSINCHVAYNNASFNGFYGIILNNIINSEYISNYCGNNEAIGTAIGVCDLSTVYRNICEDNQIGMSIYRSRITEVVYNTFKHNSEYGLRTTGSYNRTIYNNNFIDNYYTNQSFFAQAYDDGNYTDVFGWTFWYDEISMQGNYWSDLVWFPGANYVIDGAISNIDLYPSENPISIPEN